MPVAAATVARLVELERLCQGPEAWSATLVRDAQAGTTWLLDDEGRGYVALGVVGEVADLQRIGVDPSHRRQGVASALLRRAEVAARDAGADRMLLEVAEGNAAALALYAAHGFVEIARRPRYYKDGSAAVVMQLVLGEEGA
jgi:[ribosomal protein S18]-alanine N-acetyltransferase